VHSKRPPQQHASTAHSLSAGRMEWGVPLYGDHAVYRAAVPFLTVMIALEQRSCDRLGSQLHSIAPKFACVLATRFSDVQVRNGTALVSPPGAHVGSGHADMQVLYHYPPVHPETFSVGVREVAILVSHLRAIAVGRKFLRSEQASANRDKKAKGHFLVLEEDAELGLLLSTRYDWITTLLAALPSKWTVLQGAVIAELPWLKHLHKRLSASRRPFVARQSLRGLSWPFSPPRVLWANCSWVKPYWSAAAYIVSYRGANELLQRYWPRAPRLVGSTIDTRTQLWPAADQLIFNLSTSFLSHPFVTQPAEGTHSEHARFKREARDFVFNTWMPEWGRLKETKTVLASIFMIDDVGNEDFESVSHRSRKLDGICFQGAAQARAQPQRLRCRRLGELPAHILVRPLKLHWLSISTTIAALRQWLVDVGIHVPADALVWREPSNLQARAAAGAAAELLALRAAVDAAKSARMLSSRLNEHLSRIEDRDLVNSDHKGLIPTGLAAQSTYADLDLPPFVLFAHRHATPTHRQQVRTYVGEMLCKF